MNGHPGAGHSGRFAKKGSFALIGLNKVEVAIRGDGQDKPWETGSGPEIDGAVEAWRQIRKEIQGVLNVSFVEMGFIATGDEIDRAVPMPHEVGKRLQALGCFT
jgi:hypothetical protein